MKAQRSIHGSVSEQDIDIVEIELKEREERDMETLKKAEEEEK